MESARMLVIDWLVLVKCFVNVMDKESVGMILGQKVYT